MIYSLGEERVCDCNLSLRNRACLNSRRQGSEECEELHDPMPIARYAPHRNRRLGTSLKD